jgi:hypothetical protein
MRPAFAQSACGWRRLPDRRGCYSRRVGHTVAQYKRDLEVSHASLGIAAVQAGHKVRYYTAADLVDAL